MKFIHGKMGQVLCLAAFVGLCFTTTSYFAKASELKMVSSRLDQKIAQDKVEFWQRQLYQFEAAHGKDPQLMTTSEKERYWQLQKILNDAIKELRKAGG